MSRWIFIVGYLKSPTDVFTVVAVE